MEVVPLRRLASVVNGGTPPADREFWGGEVAWATPVDLARVDGGAITATDRTLTPEGLARSGAVPRGSVVLSTRAPIGYVSLAGTDMAFNQGCKGIVPGPALDGRYLQFWLWSQRPSLQALGTGSTFMELGNEALMSVGIPARSTEEQQRIADFLDDQTARIDQIIAARRKQVALLRHAVLERRREVTTIGMSTPRRATGIEWMPEVARDWPVLRIARLFRTGSGTTPTTTNPAYFGGDIAWVNTGDITDQGISAIPKAVTEAALVDFPALRVFEAGALVIAMYGQGATKGRVGVLPVSACVNQACCVLEPTGRVLVEWAAAWFQAHKDQIVELAIGSGQPNLSQEIIRSLRMPAPPIETQRTLLTELATETAIITAACEGIERSIELLLEFKSSLTSAAVSGEFEVSAASGRGVPA